MKFVKGGQLVKAITKEKSLLESKGKPQEAEIERGQA